ncbi:dTMP kinase [uncultured Arthrobacter sp.]|uniref:dTMP kinase n=1 Tax=uncultured Arthrobacter sp. TaxID=114050 RepID=UPI0026040E34|nr:dTMP kinase [uncultured Arthrobacter sp.]
MTHFTRNPQVLRVVLLGIDGAGKTTAARSVLRKLREHGIEAELLRNPGGRRTLDRWASRHSRTAEALLGPRVLDTIESCLRVLAVLRSTLQARRRRGVVLFDRHLQCQLALRQVRGLPAGRLVPWLLRVLPQPDLVVYLDVDPRAALARITSRNTDMESLEFLTALDAAYRQLPGFETYALVDANGTAAEIAAALWTQIASRLLPSGPPLSAAALTLQPLPVREGAQAGQ